MGSIKRTLGCAAAAGLTLVLSGCVGSSLAKKEDVVYMETSVNREISSLRRDIDACNARTEDAGTESQLALRRLADRVDGLESRVAALETKVGRAEDAQAALEKDLRRAVSDGDSRVEKNVDAKIDTLLDAVVKENKKIVQQFNRRQNVAASEPQAQKKPASQSAAQSSGGGDTVQGYYHTVERGQSLSKIAAIYGVSLESILKENDLSDPDKVSVGQQVFIPQDN